MGDTGPIPQDANAVALRGGRHAKDAAITVRQPCDLIAAPKTLKADGKDQWNNLLPELISRGVITSVDMFAFERYCIACQDYRRVRKQVNKSGIERGNGINPLWYVLRDIEKDLVMYEKQFGLTPSARLRIKIIGPISNADEEENDCT